MTKAISYRWIATMLITLATLLTSHDSTALNLMDLRGRFPLQCRFIENEKSIVLNSDQAIELSQEIDSALLSLQNTIVFRRLMHDALNCNPYSIQNALGASANAAARLAANCDPQNNIDEEKKYWKSSCGLNAKKYYAISNANLQFESWTDLNNQTYINFLSDKNEVFTDSRTLLDNIKRNRSSLLIRVYHEAALAMIFQKDRNAMTNIEDNFARSSINALKALRLEWMDRDALLAAGVSDRTIGAYSAVRNNLSESSCRHTLKKSILPALLAQSEDVIESTSIDSKLAVMCSSRREKSQLDINQLGSQAEESLDNILRTSQNTQSSQVSEPCLEMTKPILNFSCYNREFGPRPRISGSGE